MDMGLSMQVSYSSMRGLLNIPSVFKIQSVNIVLLVTLKKLLLMKEALFISNNVLPPFFLHF